MAIMAAKHARRGSGVFLKRAIVPIKSVGRLGAPAEPISGFLREFSVGRKSPLLWAPTPCAGLAVASDVASAQLDWS